MPIHKMINKLPSFAERCKVEAEKATDENKADLMQLHADMLAWMSVLRLGCSCYDSLGGHAVEMLPVPIKVADAPH